MAIDFAVEELKKEIAQSVLLGVHFHNLTNQTITDKKGKTNISETKKLRKEAQDLYNKIFNVPNLTKEKPQNLIDLEKNLLEKYGEGV